MLEDQKRDESTGLLEDDADEILYSFEKIVNIPNYKIIKRADLVTRPDGIFVMCLFGDLIDKKYFDNARLIYYSHSKGFRLAFRKYGLRDSKGRYMPTKDFVFADVECIGTQAVILPVLKSHKWFDVFLFKSGVSGNDMTPDLTQNFIACASR